MRDVLPRRRCSPTRRPGFCLVLGLLLLPWALAACQPIPTTPLPAGAIVHWQTLAQYPEYTLFYPGSTVIGQGGVDAETGPFSYSRAGAGATLGIDVPSEQVLAFYQRELAARGWQESAKDGITTTSDLDAYGWRKGHIGFRLAFPRKNDPHNPVEIDRHQTPYTIALSADDPRDPTWSSQPQPSPSQP